MQPDTNKGIIRELAFALLFWSSLTSLLFWPIISGAKSVFFGDLSLYFIPQFANISAAMSDGKLLFWNHTILGGIPHVGNPQGWLLYPTVWLNALLPAWHVAGLIPVLHIPIAALGMHFLTRLLRFSVIASSVAAGTFAYASVLLTKAQFPNMVQAIAWTPWILAAVIVCIRRPKLASAAFLAITGGLSVCAGHAQITWMDALLCLALVAWKCRTWRMLGVLAIAAIGIVLVSAAYLFPMLEITAWSGRDHMSLMEANRFRVPAAGLLEYITAVHVGGDPLSMSGFSWRGNAWEVSAFFGSLTPILVMMSVVPRFFFKQRQLTGIGVVATMCGIGWWLSLGVQGGLFPLVFRLVPGAKAFHDPARFLHYVHIGVPILLGYAVTNWEKSTRLQWVTALLGLANLISLTIHATSWYPVVDSRIWNDVSAFYAPLRHSVLYTQNDRETWLHYANPKSFESVRTIEAVDAFLKSGVPNIPGIWGVVSAGGYEPVAPKATLVMQGWTGATPIYNMDALFRAGVTHTITPSGAAVPLPIITKHSIDTSSRIVNGWRVYAKSSVLLPVLRTRGWVIGRGQTLTVREAPETAGLVVSGAGQITYQPASFRLGLFFTMVALGILAGITLHTVRFARKV